MESRINPFKSIEDFELLMSKQQTMSLLNRKNICFCEEIWDNPDCSDDIDWIVIRAESGINFFFAKEKMFKIYVEFP